MDRKSPQKPVVDGLVDQIRGRGGPEDEKRIQQSVGNKWTNRFVTTLWYIFLAGVASLTCGFTFWGIHFMVDKFRLLLGM